MHEGQCLTDNDCWIFTIMRKYVYNSAWAEIRNEDLKRQTLK